MNKLSLLLCVLLSVNAKSTNNHKTRQHGNSEKRIVGGELTTITKYPYQAALEYAVIPNFYYRFICGGSIISDRHILTAGHCIVDGLRVKLGTDSIINPLAKTIPVEKSYIHPQYKLQNDIPSNDVAVLKLKSPISFNDRIGKIDLPPANWQPSNSIATLTGWGLFFTYLQVPSLLLMKADVPIITNDECTSAFKNGGIAAPVENTNICTLNQGIAKAACSGDSGGPLAQDNKVVGIVSWGARPCEQRGAPSVYAKVSSYVDWIKQIMNS